MLPYNGSVMDPFEKIRRTIDFLHKYLPNPFNKSCHFRTCDAYSGVEVFKSLSFRFRSFIH